uniref:Uncharacterized protein n=1 Tax=Arion vulgaris TaxID=1028688 RepID=A0A0B7BVB0_9EUPU
MYIHRIHTDHIRSSHYPSQVLPSNLNLEYPPHNLSSNYTTQVLPSNALMLQRCVHKLSMYAHT